MLIIIVALILGAGVFMLAETKNKAASSQKGTAKGYEFATLKRGTIEKTISTTGTLQPVNTVNVLPQMSGRVDNVYVNYNDRVRKDQTLASINTDMLKLQEIQSEAALQKAQAAYDLQKITYDNNVKLAAKGLVSDFDLAASKANLDMDAADISNAKASLETIKTEINQYALIKSPIDGIVLDMNIDVGQEVVDSSSQNTTTIFTLAANLSEMQIKASVDELDITNVKVGQPVRFTVQSDPATSYPGTVREIHQVPNITNNVVTYYVIVDAPNKQGKLINGMTANMDFIVARKDDALLVPNAALRYTPTGLGQQELRKLVYLAGLPPDQRQAAAERFDEAARQPAANAPTRTGPAQTGLGGLMVMRGPGFGFGGNFNRNGANRTGAQGAGQGQGGQSAAAVKKPLWYVDGQGKIACALVDAGISDGINTEVSGSEDLASLKIILRDKVD